jgi:cyclopropane-fatty-acyl-phospholipid synthase
MTQTIAANPSSNYSIAHSDVAMRILKRLLEGFNGSAGLRLWNDKLHIMGEEAPAFTLVLRDPMLLRKLITARSPVMLADAYFKNQMDFEGDLYSVLALKTHFETLSLTWRDKLSLLLDAWRLPEQVNPHKSISSRIASRFSHEHSKHSDRAAISFHYDVSNEFYGLWLDSQRIYSCAYFENEEDTLDRAQHNKLEHICRKLRLQPGEQLLDIGCGWGALICWAAKHYGVIAHGITLSQQQLEYTQQRIIDEGLEDFVTVELRDYRDLHGEYIYDKISSIGMFEHVGLDNLPAYLTIVNRMLRPNGLFLNHGITHDEEGWNKTVASEFINRYVFPDGEFDCVSNIQLGMERAGFEIQDVEALRRHYALTLRHWVKRLEENREAALCEVDEPTYRVWRLYMAACALEFEAGGTGIYQILASKLGADPHLPMTRQDLYTTPDDNQSRFAETYQCAYPLTP